MQYEIVTPVLGNKVITTVEAANSDDAQRMANAYLDEHRDRLAGDLNAQGIEDVTLRAAFIRIVKDAPVAGGDIDLDAGDDVQGGRGDS